MRSTPMAAAKTERLLNLVIALLSTRRAVSKAELRRLVAPYREASTPEAFERMFERDKEELRDLGIPLLTEPLDAFFDDEPGYRIDRVDYALPDLRFAPDELALLAFAGRAWAQASLSDSAVRGLRKLESAVEEDLDDVHGDLAGIHARIRTREPAFEEMRRAVVAGRAVSFAYQGRAGATTTRHVQPWGIAAWHGRWYVTGHDVDRGEQRVFRLDRVQSDVTTLGPPGGYEVPAGHDPRAVIAASVPAGDVVEAVVWVRPGKGHDLRRRALPAPESTTFAPPPGWERLVVEGHLGPLSDELVGYGADIVVQAPDALRQAVVTRLRAVLRAHAGPASGARR